MNQTRRRGSIIASTAANVPYWLDTAPRPAVRATTEPSRRVDVAVVGGGFTGLTAALNLAQGGAHVAVIEKGVVGSGASGRNGGMCTTGMTISFGLGVKRYGEDAARRMYLAYNHAIDYVESVIESESIDCSWQRSGRMTLAAKPSHFEGFKQTQEALREIVGQKTVLVPKEGMRDEIGSDLYHGGIVDPLGAGLHVGRLANGLAEAAERSGAEVHEQNEATRIRRTGSSGFTVETPRGRITADRVLVATNAYTARVVPWLGRRVAPVGSFIIVTEPLGESVCAELLPNRRMASTSLSLLYYFRITPDNRLLFGGRARFALSSPDSDQKSAEILERGMAKVYPQLAGVRIDYAWGGLVGFALDRMPHAGERDGLFYSVAYAGHGVQMATYMGHQMANTILGKPAHNPWADVPFRAIPGHFGPTWYLPFAGAYYRLKDRLK